MPFYTCIVNEVGPAADGTETTAPVIYINLTDTAGSFTNTWFYAAQGIQEQALDVGISAIEGPYQVEVAATAPNIGGSPSTGISRIYGWVPRGPAAPTDFSWRSTSPLDASSGTSLVTVAWKDNSDDEEGFTIYAISSGGQFHINFPANSTGGFINLPSGNYGMYVGAFNSAGVSTSNSIVVSVPPIPPTVSADVLQIQVGIYELVIVGGGFFADEQITISVNYVREGVDSTTHELAVTADSTGGFRTQFNGNNPAGLCYPGQASTSQIFVVTATATFPNRQVETTSAPFVCPAGSTN